METILKILTLGLYGLFVKSRNGKSAVKKTVYRKDGILKKMVEREVEYTSEEPEMDESNFEN